MGMFCLVLCESDDASEIRCADVVIGVAPSLGLVQTDSVEPDPATVTTCFVQPKLEPPKYQLEGQRISWH